MTVPVPAGLHPVSAIVTSPGRAIIAAQVSLASGRANMGNVSGTLPVANGGTGATNAEDARANLGIEDVVSMTTDQVDDVMDDGESIVSDNVVNGTVFSYIWGKIRAWGDAMFAPASHTHSQSQINDTPITVANGGTGATTESAARTSLGITPANIGAAPTSHNHSGQALTPASVAATGAVSGSSVSDSVGSLAALRESVNQTVSLTGSDCEFAKMGTLDNFPDQLMRFEIGNRGKTYRFVVQAGSLLLFDGYTLLAKWNKDA